MHTDFEKAKIISRIEDIINYYPLVLVKTDEGDEDEIPEGFGTIVDYIEYDDKFYLIINAEEEDEDSIPTYVAEYKVNEDGSDNIEVVTDEILAEKIIKIFEKIFDAVDDYGNHVKLQILGTIKCMGQEYLVLHEVPNCNSEKESEVFIGEVKSNPDSERAHISTVNGMLGKFLIDIFFNY